MTHRTVARITIAVLLTVAATVAHAKPPLWDKKISGKGRFKVLKEFDGEAVLDRETGLVWERVPAADAASQADSFATCVRNGEAGGRRGWRLAEIHELFSLTDPDVATTPFLPEGHPFDLGGGSLTFWSATADGPTSGYQIDLDDFGGLTLFHISNLSTARRWCVRAGGTAGVND